MKTFEKILDWVLISSKDPTKVSLTVKGALLSIVPIFIALSNLTSLKLESEQLTLIVEIVAQFIQAIFGAVSLIVTAYGLVRKIIASLKGENLGYNQYHK